MGVLQLDARRLPIADGVVDLVVTDPPYGVMTNKKEIKRLNMKSISRYEAWDDLTLPQWQDLMLLSMREMYRVCRDGATAYVFCSGDFVSYLREIAEYTGWKWRMPFYQKLTNPAPKVRVVTYQSAMQVCGVMIKGKRGTFNKTNGGRCHNFFEGPMPPGRSRSHPTEKSLKLMEQLILDASNEGDLVMDSFMGSGVVGLAARNLGRRYVVGEVNWDYCKGAREKVGLL